MSVIATAVKHLIAAGVTGDDLVRAVAEMEAAAPQPVDRAAERRRAYDRERKRSKAKRSTGIPVESADSAEHAPPNDIYSNPPENPVSANADTAPLPNFSEKVALAWNAMAEANGLATIRSVGTARAKHLKARVREHGEPAVLEAIAKLGRSDWHCARGDSMWRADFGWLIESPKNFQRILERPDAANDGPAKPANPADFLAVCDREIERFRSQGNEREAKAWEARKNGTPPRREATGPPRSIGDLLPAMGAH